MKDKTDHLSMAIYQVAGQLLEIVKRNVESKLEPKLALLTCHDTTYLAFVGKDSTAIEISSMIDRKDFLYAVLLVLCVYFPPFGKALGYDFDSFKTLFANEQRPPIDNSAPRLFMNRKHEHNLRSLKSNSSKTKHKDATKLDESDDSGIECFDITFDELIKSREGMVFIGDGGCGLVYRILINVYQ